MTENFDTSPGRDRTFLLQFLMDMDEKTKQILDDICREYGFFLVEKGEENPWAYKREEFPKVDGFNVQTNSFYKYKEDY